jgi:uncharacterized protein (DUF2236 family)
MPARPLASPDYSRIELAASSVYSDALTERQMALIRSRWDGMVVFLAGPSNVVIQLSNYAVGRGVIESTVHSGSVYEHPFKRFRTTVGYLDIAMFGDDQLRADYRNAINTAHRQVRSTAASPVKYNAFNRDLQLWVASSIYYGMRDGFILMRGPLTSQEEEDLLQAGQRFGTTLQVPPSMWHKNRAAFEEYWSAGMRNVHFDAATRKYLLGIINAEILPGGLRHLVSPSMRFFNTGFLPPEIRDQLGLSWTDQQDRKFRAILRGLGQLDRPVPAALRRIPANWMSLNHRARRALGRPLI